jgi:hypothetical protein
VFVKLQLLLLAQVVAAIMAGLFVVVVAVALLGLTVFQLLRAQAMQL